MGCPPPSAGGEAAGRRFSTSGPWTAPGAAAAPRAVPARSPQVNMAPAALAHLRQPPPRSPAPHRRSLAPLAGLTSFASRWCFFPTLRLLLEER